MGRCLRALVLGLALGGHSGCHSSHQGEAAPAATGVSLNDVAILLPVFNKAQAKLQINSSDQPNPDHVAPGQPAAPLDQQAFVPQIYLAQLDQELLRDGALRQKEDATAWQLFSAGSLQDGSLFKDVVLQAVSLRLDPCGNALTVQGDAQACAPELRINWQSGGSDLSVRTVYKLTTAELLAAATTLSKLAADSKLDYAKSPLNVQPAIAQQGVTGAYYQGVVGLVHRYARATRLSELSGLVNSAPADPHGLGSWSMLQLTFGSAQPTAAPLAAVTTASGQAVKTVQRTLGHLLTNVKDKAGNQAHALGLPSPLGSSAYTVFPAGEIDEPLLAPLAESLAQIESPLKVDRTTVDCATCHRALPVRKVVAAQPDPTQAFKSAHWQLQNMTPTAEIPFTAMQMFSYRLDQDGSTLQPVIAQRTINESAFAADYINAHVLN